MFSSEKLWKQTGLLSFQKEIMLDSSLTNADVINTCISLQYQGTELNSTLVIFLNIPLSLSY